MGLEAKSMIYSEHYNGPSTDKIVISKGAPHISRGGRAPSFWFDYPSSDKNFMANSFTAYPANNNDKFYIVTANNSYKVGKEDIGPNFHKEYFSKDFLKWKAAGEGSNGISYQDNHVVSRGLIMLPEKPLSFHPNDTSVNLYVRPSIDIGPNRNNDIGKLISKAANDNQMVRNWVFGDWLKGPDYDVVTGDYSPFNEIALKWTRYLISKGEDAEGQILGVGTEDFGDQNILARIYSKSYIALSKDLREKAWKQAESRGLRGEAAQVFVEEYVGKVIAHEWRHSRERKRRSTNKTEALAGEFEEDFYANEAALREGTLKGKIYGMLSKMSAAYASHYRGKQGLSGFFNRLKRIAINAREEAEYMDMDEEAQAEYVESKVKEFAEEETAEGLEAKVDEGTEDIEDSPRETDDMSEEGVDNSDGATNESSEPETSSEMSDAA